MLKKIMTAFLVFVLSIPTFSWAQSSEKRWSLGGGIGTGIGWAINFDLFGDEPGDDWVTDGATGGFFLVRYSFNDWIKFRLLGGAGLAYGEGVDGTTVIPIANLGLDFHIKKGADSSFDPYVPVGVGFPEIIYAGFGNEFHLKNDFSVFTEVTGSTAIVFYGIAFKIGVLKYF